MRHSTRGTIQGMLPDQRQLTPFASKFRRALLTPPPPSPPLSTGCSACIHILLVRLAWETTLIPPCFGFGPPEGRDMQPLCFLPMWGTPEGKDSIATFCHSLVFVF